MIRLAIYEKKTGQIVQISHAIDKKAVLAACGPSQRVIEVGQDVDDGTHIVRAGKLHPRPAQAGAAAAEARRRRDVLLAASDWTQVADAPVNRAAWAAYRAALRDVPRQKGFPDAVAWPTRPT